MFVEEPLQIVPAVLEILNVGFGFTTTVTTLVELGKHEPTMDSNV
jgi:hypothetical protein